ncbi:MAG: hypothetical protein DRO11_00375 [Methanobacteriota archaeon]|nr:MAG: hypothetical protein DRO11_00375 [Euryarchaeota archaeon]
MVMVVPEEPERLREEIRELMLRWRTEESADIDWDNLALWYGNKIPKYFWDNWKTELKKRGFTWQKFLKLMRYRTTDAMMWVLGDKRWKEFVKTVREDVEGPLGKRVIGK